jgi:opacity protein-like surface antigen
MAVAVSMFILAPAAGAQTVTANDDGGVAFGFQLLSSFIGAEDRPANPPEGAVYVDEVAPGFQIWGGYAFSRAFLLRLSIANAAHATDDADVDVQVGSVMIEAVYHLATSQNLRPYLLGGLGGYTLRSSADRFDFESNGSAVDIGAGINYFVSRRVSFDLSARADFINWDRTKATVTLPDGGKVTLETPVDESGSAAKILFGVGVWF